MEVKHMDNLKILERRIAKLEERIQRQKIGPEVETSKKILFVLKKKYAELAKNNTVLIAEATTSSLHSTLTIGLSRYASKTWLLYLAKIVLFFSFLLCVSAVSSLIFIPSSASTVFIVLLYE